MNRPTFGRRGLVLPARTKTMGKPLALALADAAGSLPLDLEIEPQSQAPEQSHAHVPDDDELREWKSQRSFKVPWRQLSLMASICFGLASFVLPPGIGDTVNWLLYVLSAISFYVWISEKLKKKKSLSA